MTDTASRCTVSLVIPCRNSRETLTRVLERVAELNPAPEETILVDDGSHPPLKNMEETFPIHYVRLDPGMGPAAARNAGAAHARGDVLLFIDADVLVDPAVIALVEKYFRDPSIDAVQGIYASDTLSQRLASRYQNDYYHYVFSLSSRDCAICATFCFAVRRDVFLSMGGFDTRILKPTVEDEVFGYRLAAAGYRIRLAPEIRVVHLAEYTISSLLRRKIRMSFNQAKQLWCGFRPATWSGGKPVNRSHHPLDICLAVLLAPLLPAAWCAGWEAGLLVTGLYGAGNMRLSMYLISKRKLGAPAYLCVMWLDQCATWLGLAAGTLTCLTKRR